VKDVPYLLVWFWHLYFKGKQKAVNSLIPQQVQKLDHDHCRKCTKSEKINSHRGIYVLNVLTLKYLKISTKEIRKWQHKGKYPVSNIIINDEAKVCLSALHDCLLNTGQFKRKVTLSHVYNEVTSEPTIMRYTTIVRKTPEVCL
jgi:hypothetical protein